MLGIISISRQLDVSPSSLRRDMRLVVDLKDAFGLSVQDEEAERWQTVGQVIDYVRAHRKP